MNNCQYSFLNHKNNLLITDEIINNITHRYEQKINSYYSVNTRKQAALYFENKKTISKIFLGYISSDKMPHSLSLEEETKDLINELNNYKKEVEMCYVKRVGYLWHMTDKNGLHMIRASRNCRDAFHNEIVDAVFASSSYDGNLLFTARAAVGKVRVYKNKLLIFPDSPFSTEKKLIKTVSEYCISAEGFEPTYDFRCDGRGNAHIIFSREWTLQKDYIKGIENQISIMPDDFFSIYNCYYCTFPDLWEDICAKLHGSFSDQKAQILDEYVFNKLLVKI